MRLTSWLESWRRARRTVRRRRRSYSALAPAVDCLEDRTLLSVTTLFIDNGLSVTSDGGDAIGLGTGAAGNVQVVVNGAVDTTVPPVAASSIQAIFVGGGDLANTIDLSGVLAADYSYSDINGNLVTISVDGGNGHDTITSAADLATTIVAGHGDDTVLLLAADNIVFGGDGDDLLVGAGGDDTLDGGDGHDSIDGGDGDDSILGGDGLDTLDGGLGDDTIDGGDGEDLIHGDAGNDFINGESGADTIIGGDGDDTIFGGGAGDEIYGDSDDPAAMGTGNDVVHGQGEDDVIVGGGGADVLNGGPGHDWVRSIFAIESTVAPPPPPPQPPPPPPLTGFPDAVDSGGGTDSGTTHDMTNGPGDASLTITVNAGGDFGTASGVGGDAGATYDPVGPAPPAATTTFESLIHFRNNTANPTGTRDTLTNLATNLSTIRGLPTEANSTFDIGSVSFALTQTVTPMIDATTGNQTGSLLTQTARFTNTGSSLVDFELVRYIDGDLYFDGTLIDGGGRFVTGNSEEVLFETDSGGSGTTDTTFLGITAKHGTVPATARFEIDAYRGLLTRIEAGTALDEIITGDADGDEFIDAGSEYDATLALQNLFSLAPAESGIYTTHTIFGSGAPSAVGGGSQVPVAVDDAATTRANTTVIVDVVSNDFDPDGALDYSTVLIVTAPANGIAVSMLDGRVSYQPDPGFFGTDLFVYTVEDFDGMLSNPATVTITITPPDPGDTLNGGSGNDTLDAADGSDRLFGGAGNDDLDGAVGNDSLNGQSGNDLLVAGTGSDWLNGGSGNDFLDSRTLVNVSIDDIRIDPEGDSGTTPAVFTITLSSATDVTVTVDYGTSSDGTISGGTALANIDYVGTLGTAVIPAGQLSTTITIPVIGDLIDEVIEETFFVSLFNPVNVLVFDGLGEGRIIDDDDPPPGGIAVTPTLDQAALVSGLTGAGGAGLIVTGSSIQGHQNGTAMSTGTFTVGQAATYGLTRPGIVISSGDAGDYSDGPDTSGANSTSFGVAATVAQEALLDPITGGGFDHNDVTQIDINFDMLPGFDTLYFDVVFGSEEWPVFVGSFTDGFGLYVNGSNIAMVAGLPVNIDHPDMTPIPGTELNAVLAPNGNPRLQFSAFVGDGSTGNTVTFIVADLIDTALDTTVYLSSLGGSLPLDTPPPPSSVSAQTLDDTLLGRSGNDTLMAGEGFDRLNGGGDADTLHGGGGEDQVYGGGGDDVLNGGTGDDTLFGQGGNDTLYGNLGDDRLVWEVGGGSDLLDGNEGFDIAEARGNSADNTLTVLQNNADLLIQTDARLQVSDGVSITTLEFSIPQLEVNGGAGADTINMVGLADVPSRLVRFNGQGGDDVITAAGVDPGVVRLVFDGGDGNDLITGSLGADTIYGGDGDDTIGGDAGTDTINGGDGDDVLDGQDGDDVVYGQLGFDTLNGGNGDDFLSGGEDRDFMVGDAGADTLTGGSGSDTLNGKSGDDSLLGDAGADRLYGGNGNDTLDGGRDDDSLYGHSGDDKIRGDHGDDSIRGGRGDDTLNGGDGNDRIYAERGDDLLAGGDGNDTLNGSRGDDILVGGDGADTLLGGSGRDIVLGELGDDYVKGQGSLLDTVAGGEGIDLLFDSPAEIDENFKLSAQLIADLDAF